VQSCVSDTFWNNCAKQENGCWLWTKSTTRGYGELHYKGTTRKAHRVAWELTYGDIPKGMVVCHRCDNPRCINPDHLFIGTQADNIKDCIEKGRARHISPRGESNPRAVLTEQQVIDARRRYRQGGVFYKELAAEYGVGFYAIAQAVKGKSWAWLEC
jgi:hypothetical protein